MLLFVYTVPTHNKHIFVRPKMVCLFYEMCLFWKNLLISGSRGFRKNGLLIIGNVVIMGVLIMRGDSITSIIYRNLYWFHNSLNFRYLRGFLWVLIPEFRTSFRDLLTYHEDSGKRGGMWCGGTRENREPRVTIGWLLPIENIFSNLPAS